MRKINFEHFQTAKIQGLRSTNRAIVLNFIRYHQPIPRVEIAQRTGLQRSTVSLIVDDLIRDGSILEQRATSLRRGGVPRLLSINTEGHTAIGIDIELSEVTVALADMMGSIADREVFPTPEDPAELVQAIGQKVNRMVAASRREGALHVGVAVSGLVDHQAGTILTASNLGWTNFPLGPKLQKRLNAPVLLDNEGNLCALAEIWHGDFSDRSCPDLVFVNVKEGIGTGLVIGGRLYRGFASLAAEFGHMIIQSDGPQCSCGNRGCWEMLADNRAMVERFTTRQPGAMKGKKRDGHAVTIDEVIRLAIEGNPAAREALTESVQYLAVGLQNIVVGLNPEFVVIAGAITQAWSLVTDQLQIQMRKGILGLPFERTRVIPTSLREKPSLVGALSLATAASFGLPSLQ
jgi:predicted NBD/HSP70 family sugar kinase